MNVYERDFFVDYVSIGTDGVLSDYGFFKIFQEIGCYQSDSFGFGVNDTPNTGLAWVILDWKIKIFSRPKWNDKLHVITWPSGIDHIHFLRDYEILDMAGNRVAIASSRWILYNIFEKKIFKLSSQFCEKFSIDKVSIFDTPFLKLNVPSEFDSCFEYRVLKRDIDTNMHLNNLNYILLAHEVLPEDTVYSNIEVMYKKQCLLWEDIACLYKKVSENEHLVCVKSKDLQQLHCVIRFR